MTQRRHVVEAEVPGTPEQVWEAIATGPGITAWFVPTEVDGREGGEVVTHLGTDDSMVSRGRITAYEPPHRFAYVEPWDDVDFATEFLVEARGGGTCVVRIVSSGFGEGEEWDRRMEGQDRGWRFFLGNLRLYLGDHAGAPAAQIVADAPSPGQAPAAALATLIAALGLPADPTPGTEVATGRDAPRFTGVVDRIADEDLAIRIHDPAPGLVVASAFEWDSTRVRVQAYLYGEDAHELAERLTPAWRDWLGARFAGSGVA